MITENEARTTLGANVVDSSGSKLGSVGQIYLDDQTGMPEWATVKTGLFGSKESFVPLTEANLVGSDLQVPYDTDRIKGAPRVEAEQGHLSQSEEQELYSYYGLQYTDNTSDSGLPTGTAGFTGRSDDNAGILDDASDRTSAYTTTGLDATGAEGTGYDTSGPTTDDAMTRSEEQLRVGTEQVEAGRARLRKYIVTENVTTTVPVSREEVRLEREPVTDANRGQAMSGPDLSEEEHEVVLHAERPVVDKETVPVERVRLSTETVTDQETVTDEVRKEQIDLDDNNR